jgi:hypothetical protein
MKFNESLMFVVVAVAGGCTTQVPDPDFDSPIGVKRVAVEESDSTLAITGYTANGELIAHIDLRTGTFYSDELKREVDGRQLRVEVRGRVAIHESAGHRTLKLPLLTGADGAESNELLLDPRVRPLLSSWQIEINDARPNPLQVPVAPSGDSSTPYSSCNFMLTLDCMGNGSYSCAQAGQNFLIDQQCIWGFAQDVCCASVANGGIGMSAQKAAMRMCGMGVNNPCGDEGPNGCGTCWSVPWTTSCVASTGGQAPRRCTDLNGISYTTSTDLLNLSYN